MGFNTSSTFTISTSRARNSKVDRQFKIAAHQSGSVTPLIPGLCLTINAPFSRKIDQQISQRQSLTSAPSLTSAVGNSIRGTAFKRVNAINYRCMRPLTLFGTFTQGCKYHSVMDITAVPSTYRSGTSCEQQHGKIRGGFCLC